MDSKAKQADFLTTPSQRLELDLAGKAIGLSINFLALEVSRQCSGSCENCMRGQAQALQMGRKVIDALFDKRPLADGGYEQICYVNNLYFTGGDPARNGEGVDYTADVVTLKELWYESVGLLTAGLEYSRPMVNGMTKLVDGAKRYQDPMVTDSFLPSATKMADGLAVRTSEYHKTPVESVMKRYRSLPFFTEIDGSDYFEKHMVLPFGKAIELYRRAGYGDEKIDAMRMAILKRKKEKGVARLRDMPALFSNGNEMLVELPHTLYICANGNVAIIGDADYKYLDGEGAIGNLFDGRSITQMLIDADCIVRGEATPIPRIYGVLL
jgi:hypothetical protein